MIRHDFHLEDGTAKIGRNLREQLLQAVVDAVHQDFAPEFGAKDYMILAAVYDVFTMVIWSV